MISFRAATPEDLRWLLGQINYNPSGQFKGITALKDGKVCTVVGFDHWTLNSVQMHVASRNPRGLAPLWLEVVGFVGQHGRRLIYGVTPSDNVKSLRLQRRLGFRELYRLQDGWSDGVDMVISEFKIHEQRH